MSDVAAQIEKLAALRAAGAVTEDEFAALKRKLIATESAVAEPVAPPTFWWTILKMQISQKLRKEVAAYEDTRFLRSCRGVAVAAFAVFLVFPSLLFLIMNLLLLGRQIDFNWPVAVLLVVVVLALNFSAHGYRWAMGCMVVFAMLESVFCVTWLIAMMPDSGYPLMVMVAVLYLLVMVQLMALFVLAIVVENRRLAAASGGPHAGRIA